MWWLSWAKVGPWGWDKSCAESNYIISFIFFAPLNFASLSFVKQFETMKKSVRWATSRLDSKTANISWLVVLCGMFNHIIQSCRLEYTCIWFNKL